jgi:hypothetical protein
LRAVSAAAVGAATNTLLDPSARPGQNSLVTEEQGDAAAARSFLACVVQVARLLGVEAESEDAAAVPESRRARRLAAAMRRPLLERASLPEELFAPLMAAAVHDPDPSLCRWCVEPALYAFGRRRVRAALVDYLRTGTDAERAGAERAWYCAQLPLRASRSPAYGPGGTRDPALDESRDLVNAWWETSLQVLTESTDVRMCHRVLYWLPTSHHSYPPPLHGLLEKALATARSHSDQRLRSWAAAVDGGRSS